MGGVSSGRFPQWAKTKAQREFVLRHRASGNSVTLQDFKLATAVNKLAVAKKSTKKLSKNRQIVDLLIADNSGSMMGRRAQAARNGMNQHFTILAESAKKLGIKTLCKVNMFDTRHQVLRLLESVDSIAPIDIKEYSGNGGSTALNDAIVKGIMEMENMFGKKKNKNVDLSIIIFTDGEENASREFNVEQAKDAVKRAESYGWRVVFMGEGAAANYAQRLEIAASNTLSYTDTGNAMKSMSVNRTRMSQTYAATGVSNQVGFFAQP